MTKQEAQITLDKIIGQIFGYQNTLNLRQFKKKFAFDISIPFRVKDSLTNTTTWSQSNTPPKFLSLKNAQESSSIFEVNAKLDLQTIEDILHAWSSVNYYTTEKQIDSFNVSQSDNITQSRNIYKSQDVRDSKDILFCDGVGQSEFVAASQRAANNSFCIRIEDSSLCSNSFQISWSSKINNCIFIHDCYDMQDSMFCTNMSGKRYCVANMQYTKEEYLKLQKIVAVWLLTPTQ